MTPQPTDHKLAEYVALLCKISSYAKADGIEYSLTSHFSGAPFIFSAEEMFNNKIIAPIIRHLIEEEMESRVEDPADPDDTFGWEWKCDYIAWSHGIKEAPCYRYTFCREWQVEPEFEALDKNKTRAVALAAWETGEK